MGLLVLVAAGWLLESRGFRSRWPVVAVEAMTVLAAATGVLVPDQAKGLLFAIVARRGVCGNSRMAVAVAVVLSSTAFAAAVAVAHGVYGSDAVPAGESLASVPGLVVTALVMRMLVEGLAAKVGAERGAAASRAELRAVVETSPVGLLLVDSAGAVQLYNRNAEMIIGHPVDQVIGPPIDGPIGMAGGGGAAGGYVMAVRGGTPSGNGGVPNGSLLPAAALAGEPLITSAAVAPPGRYRSDLTVPTAPVPGSCGTAVVCDVTERRRMEEQLRRQALHDELTGLANRAHFLQRVESLLAGSGGGVGVTVLLLDLDAFKTVNDTLGHAAGDLLLIEVAQRLRTCLRPGDMLARLAGDEFALLLAGQGESEATAAAQAILGVLDKPIQLRTADDVTTELRVRVSLGAVVAGLPGPVVAGMALDATALLRAADLAMYAAKRDGGHRWAVFEPAMQYQLRERVSLENALRDAMVAGDLFLHYQPCVDLETSQIASTEALMRWTDPARGSVPPVRFIPIAEDTGMIVPIGRWALNEACRQSSDWQRLTGQGLPVAVNISVRQLTDGRLIPDIGDALAAADLPAERLVLELTESELADNTVLSTLYDLKDLGVRLALDDFGTGYSALAYLRRFPIDILKIDKAFIAPITTDPSAAALTRSIIEMAHTLGLATVAEGVETAEQAAMLRWMRCQLAQGFHFAEPQPPDEITVGLRRRARGFGLG
jgi:diguanylate cyclase (GGDEF)-like protein